MSVEEIDAINRHEADVERVAKALSEIYSYRQYVGPLPSDGHREDARRVLAALATDERDPKREQVYL